jgi:hypothetical protein
VKVEIDVSEVEYGLYYKDEKCKELEKTLQSDSRYAECEVKRVQWGDMNTNPFDVIDKNDESVVLLETWEVNALSSSELLSYIEVKQKIDRPLSDADGALYGAFGALGITAVGLSISMIFNVPIMNLWFLTVPIFILTPILGVISVWTYRKSTHEKKNADLDAVERDSSFLDILRRLSESPEVDKYSKKKIVERIKNIEDALACINS